ncbi:multicopper oxidase-domain-containing protein [Schizophyllum amplum]|uniref:Multicopper oxidase-domain-containing protein n=1 Tax=Schizophyllum amplum TaxID=97359 RepID=A0A550CRP3_9AGAR|nr:multicopper oxidase-domain-containing protein [Auriculariopsis ampla]
MPEDDDEQERVELLAEFDIDDGQEEKAARHHVRWRAWPRAHVPLLLLFFPLSAVLVFFLLRPAAPKDVDSDGTRFKLGQWKGRHDQPATREFFWTVRSQEGAPAAARKPILSVNGLSPGPTIEANSHDRIIVHVTNGLEDDATSIHWHGLYQKGTNHYDGTQGITQCGIPPGETLVYNFTLDGWTGTTWWHSHTDTQHTDGLYGAIVVHDAKENVPSYDGDDLVLLLSDLYNTWSPLLAAAYLSNKDVEVAPEPVPDASVINGVGQFSSCWSVPEEDRTECETRSQDPKFFTNDLEPSKTYRLRLINAGSHASIWFSVDGHTLTVVEVDGTPVEPQRVSSLLIHVAQRYSVLLTTDRTSSTSNGPQEFNIRSRLDKGMFAYENMALNPLALGKVRYEAPPFAAADITPSEFAISLDPSTLVPADALDAPVTADALVHTKFSIQRIYTHEWRSFFDYMSWEALPEGQASMIADIANAAEGEGLFELPGDQLVASFDMVKVVDIAIDNLDDGDHPFHIHGYKPWIVSEGPGRYVPGRSVVNTTNPMRRDTFFIPAFHYAVIRIVADLPGYWAVHCHLTWHMIAGGLFQIATLPSRLNQTELPEDIVRHCAMARGGI